MSGIFAILRRVFISAFLFALCYGNALAGVSYVPGPVFGALNGATPVSGQVGQVINSTVAAGSAVTLSTGVPTNITSISCPPGTYLLFASIDFQVGATTTINYIAGSVNGTSATLSDGYFALMSAPGGSLSSVVGLTTPLAVVNFTATTTTFLVVQASFATSTLKAYGAISALRIA